MKSSILIFAIILINVLTLKTTAQNRKFHFKSIQISTKTLYYNEAMNDYAVVIYNEGIKVDSIFIEDNDELNMAFIVNQSYTFVFKKTGFETKTIIVNATIPEGLKRLSSKATKIAINLNPKLGIKTEGLTNNTEVFTIDKELGILIKNLNEEVLQSDSRILDKNISNSY